MYKEIFDYAIQSYGEQLKLYFPHTEIVANTKEDKGLILLQVFVHDFTHRKLIYAIYGYDAESCYHTAITDMLAFGINKLTNLADAIDKFNRTFDSKKVLEHTRTTRDKRRKRIIHYQRQRMYNKLFTNPIYYAYNVLGRNRGEGEE